MILKNEISKQNFREDLYYRLSVMEIKTIPLRERKDDIDVLVDDFIKKLNMKNTDKTVGVKQSYIDELKKYDWRGNIRELKNVVERDYYLSENEIKNIDSSNYNNVAESIFDEKPEEVEMKIISLDSLEKDAIIEAIKKCNGNLQLASKLLNIGRATLYRKIKKYDIYVSK